MATRRFHRERIRSLQGDALAWAHVDTAGAVSFAVIEYPLRGVGQVPPDAINDDMAYLIGGVGIHRLHPAPGVMADPRCLWLPSCQLGRPPAGADRRVLAAWAAGGFADDAVWEQVEALYRDVFEQTGRSEGGVS
jgi:hypothetical protein